MADITYANKSEDSSIPVDDPRRSFTAEDANEVKSAVNSKVDKVDGKGLSTNDYTTGEKSKVTNLPANTTTELAGKAAAVHTHAIADVTDLQTTLDAKVDKIAGKGLSENDFTDADKSKLDGLSITYVGTYTDLAALEAAHPTGQPGWEAIVDGGEGSDPQKAFWDSSDNQWVIQTGGGASSFAELAGSPNDNAALAAALAGKAALVHSHEIADVSGLQTALDAKEVASNKATSFATKNDTLYPTTKAVDDNYETKLVVIDNLDADFTPAATDLRRWKRFTGTVTRTITLPSDATLALPIGFTFPFSRAGSGAVQWAAGSGATVNSVDTATKLRGQYSAAQAVKVAANTWLIIGDISV